MKLFGKKGNVDERVEAVKKAKTKKRVKSTIIVVVVLLILAAVAFFFFMRGKRGIENKVQEVSYIYTTVVARDITSTITGSGALEPVDQYTVSSLVSGEILTSDFNKGDVVAKDTVLYTVDSSDAATSIERAENSLKKARRNYEDLLESQSGLVVKAPIDGIISGFSFETGDNVNRNAKVATIENTSRLTFTEYYSDEYINDIYKGMKAEVSISEKTMSLEGKVVEITYLRRISETGISSFGVTVEIENPGSLVSGDKATAVLVADEKIYPTIHDEKGLRAIETATVSAEVAGTVAGVFARNKESVKKGDVLMKITSDTLSDDIIEAADNVEDAELELKNRNEQLENYIITAPIEGTIVDKYYKAGENAENGRTLCTIYDLSTLTVTLSVDELDIKNIKAGQRATVTADAVEGMVYEAAITEVGITGSASGGVTTYPVTVEVYSPEGLLPGMNADVTIIVEEKLGIITVPAAAVATGSRVLKKTEDGSTGEGAPEGYEYVKVTLGSSDATYAEVVEGLLEGDEIAYLPDTRSGQSGFGNMGGMMPGMGAMGAMGGMGGMPGGNFGGSGSRPSGNFGGSSGNRGGMPSSSGGMRR